MRFIGFLSCLCGSELTGYSRSRTCQFLSCLCGSELSRLIAIIRSSVSKLPVRQRTEVYELTEAAYVSKLPVRQRTGHVGNAIFF
ncbi:hypothetical protein NMYAN_20254 [Nitrosomonas nitrosa]|uniref:Uncharacterized protein n=1 Tax=Nitrosomonas nitrosa TaxID=52442 RepID=A0A8H8YZ03_9PROT|nr:hypothetical protein NMYAN_20254 [Nitrosomonas nitrosa]